MRCSSSLAMFVEDESGHADIGCVDHPAVETRRSAAFGDCLFVGRDDALGASHLVWRWSEDRVRRLELSRVNALLTVEPHRARDAARAFEARRILKRRVRAVHA